MTIHMKAGVKQIIAGVVVFGIGAICVPFVIVLTLVRDSLDLLEFEVPGAAIAFVDTPGRYYLWHDYQTVYDGRTYNNPIELPDGLLIEITDKGGMRSISSVIRMQDLARSVAHARALAMSN